MSLKQTEEAVSYTHLDVYKRQVNKAYTVLKQEGFIQLDRRHGAVIALDADKLQALEEMRGQLQIVLAKAHCKEITREEVHELVDEIFDNYE